MKFAAIQQKLSPSSLQPFEARQLKDPVVCWINTALLTEYGYDLSSPEAIAKTKNQLIDEYAYMISNDDVGTPLTSRTRTFYGEIYGSGSEASNIGGVRCGIANDFQIKGIGRNQLTGKYVDYWHSHGGASLEEGIREAFWAEYFHHEFSEGAIRVAAIISTNHITPFDINFDELGITTTPVGALILREPSVRPSHFERVTYCYPLNPEKFENYSDVQRTRECIENIHHFLPAGENLTEQFKSLARIFSSECAKLRIRCVLHGSVTSSNTCLDGRLIDFGTASGLPDHGNYKYNPSQPPIWSNHLSFTRLMCGLLYYVNKYHPDCSADEDNIDDTEIVKHFFDHHYEHMLQELLFLSGIDVPLSGTERTPDVVKLVKYSETLLKIVTINSEREKRLSGYEGTAYYSFHQILKDLVCESPNLIVSLKGNQALLTELKNNFENAVNASRTIINNHIKLENHLKAIDISVKLRNSKPEALYKNYISIYKDIVEMEAEQNTKNLNLTAFMDEKISSSRRMSLFVAPGEALVRTKHYTKYGAECAVIYSSLENRVLYRFSFPMNEDYCLVFGTKVSSIEMREHINNKMFVLDAALSTALRYLSLPNGENIELPSDITLPSGEL
ncbi:hypothetical protein LRP49_07135 [Enterovibrio sp. ZSDZ35]|uniref:Uncharacterized protein n=1 Tax=Enterovibrio qingdaonensis TaxID=2899818 RepID=A0ABT5QK37_9GAMM|nr:hypothetical protein [Enterovibrio sp. ZSDZ35]MDD1780974.1 hypothetical protein [Enterovibrio sp. ZSDZ35]